MAEPPLDFDLTKLPTELLPAIEDLPGDLRTLAEEVGVLNTLRIVQRFRSTPIYVCNLDAWRIRWRDQCIRQEYDRGVKVPEIARRYGLSERWVWAILGRPDERQGRLF
jgi:Mor family transcriptional regulator